MRAAAPAVAGAARVTPAKDRRAPPGAGPRPRPPVATGQSAHPLRYHRWPDPFLVMR